MMNKVLLYLRVRKFYKTFGEILGSNFITKLSDITYDNLHDVLFDINEIRAEYELEYDEYGMTTYLNRLYAQVVSFLTKIQGGVQ